jgi:tetratricopeptide (TPR) repeat protein
VFCRQALTLCAGSGHLRLEASTWDSLGYAEHHMGNLGSAAECYQQALNIFRESGDRFEEADALTHLGDTWHTAGEASQAWKVWEQALAILDDLRHPNADELRARLIGMNDHASQHLAERTARAAAAGSRSRGRHRDV